MARLLLFTDEPILAKGFSALLAGTPQFDLVTICYEPHQLVEALVLSRPDIVLMDLSPQVSVEMISRARQRVPDCKIVLWVRSIPLELAYQTIRLGVHGIFRKTLSTDVLIRCLEKVAQGEFWFEEAITAGLRDTTSVALSNRESQLISLLAQGLKNKEIAHTLAISEGTIKVYLSKLFRKVGVKDRYELALYGLKNEMGQLMNTEPGNHLAPQRAAASPEDRPRLLLHRPARTAVGA